MMDFRGMTVNERLFAAGRLEAFDAAAARRDREATRRLLEGLDLSDANIDAIVDAVLPPRVG